MSTIILSVTNDLATDQRVRKVAHTLTNMGFQVKLVGRLLPWSMPLTDMPFKTKRLKLLFKKGFLFYAEYNVRLFMYLLFQQKIDVLVANDTDTLLANFLVSKLRYKPLVFDSHELFPEVPELVGRKFVKTFWKTIEKLIIPRIRYAYTVNESMAGILKEKYNTPFEIIRNVPLRSSGYHVPEHPVNFDTSKNIIVYQGVVNVARGLELAIESVALLDETILVIIGQGDIKTQLTDMVIERGLEDKIKFIDRMPPEELLWYTRQANLGIVFEENIGLNSYYALPNKVFDFIKAGVPVLASDLPEIGKLVKEYHVGEVLHSREPELVAKQMRTMLEDKHKMASYHTNALAASEQLCWELEQEKLKNIYLPLLMKI
jgi:glycosyltransferase involved in cell wall biosynthesis